jgi:DNA-binding response OmpR family regulator
MVTTRMTTSDGKTSVMIVDDDESILRSLSIVLRRKYAVQTYNSAENAVAQARAHPPDIIVLDIKMPEHDGFWVFREIRKFNSSVPIIFNSAFQDMLPPEDIGGSYAPFGYLPKNGNLTEFLNMIAAAAGPPIPNT